MDITCNEAVAIAAIHSDMNFQDYRLLASWLGCYKYVYPGERKLAAGMVGVLICPAEITNATDLFIAWQLADLIQSSLTIQEQERIISWMSQ